MYQDSNMLASIRKVEAAREENAKLDPRRAGRLARHADDRAEKRRGHD